MPRKRKESKPVYLDYPCRYLGKYATCENPSVVYYASPNDIIMHACENHKEYITGVIGVLGTSSINVAMAWWEQTYGEPYHDPFVDFDEKLRERYARPKP